MNKDILGRKIIDLIEENRVQIRENEEITEIEISKIRPNPNQPRKTFEVKALKELAQSIEVHGVIQPIIVKPTTDGYLTVAGERRVRASVIAGRNTIPAIVRDYNSIMLAELAILENLQRENLNPIEEAVAYDNIIKSLNITHLELAKKIGKSRSYVTNIIGILGLPESSITLVANKQLSLGHAKVLSKINDDYYVNTLAQKVVESDLSVRKLEEIIKKDKQERKRKKLVVNEQKNDDQIIKYFQSKYGDEVKVMVLEKEIRLKFKNKNHKNETLLKLKKNEGE